ARVEDSRAPSEAAPAVALGPITVEAGSSRPDGVDVTVDSFRRAAHVIARFTVEGAFGSHALDLDGLTSGLIARWNGVPLFLERLIDGSRSCVLIKFDFIGIDPTIAT